MLPHPHLWMGAGCASVHLSQRWVVWGNRSFCLSVSGSLSGPAFREAELSPQLFCTITAGGQRWANSCCPEPLPFLRRSTEPLPSLGTATATACGNWFYSELALGLRNAQGSLSILALWTPILQIRDSGIRETWR